MGGVSSERDISLISGEKVAKHVPRNKYQVSVYDPKFDLFKLISDFKKRKIDVVFPVLHGKYGEDGCIQGLLETFHVPYVGPRVFASSLCMHKEKTKLVASAYGILTPKYKIYQRGDAIKLSEIKLPAVIKPIDSGSSVGISIPENRKQLRRGLKKAFLESSLVMIEDFIKGREFTVGVIGNKKNVTVLPISEIVPLLSKFYDYKAKYAVGGSLHTCPAKISKTLSEKIKALAKRIYWIVEAQGMSRIDFMYSTRNKKIYFIEVNTIPGMTDVSLLPEAAKAAGISFSQLLDKLITYSLPK